MITCIYTYTYMYIHIYIYVYTYIYTHTTCTCQGIKRAEQATGEILEKKRCFADGCRPDIRRAVHPIVVKHQGCPVKGHCLWEGCVKCMGVYDSMGVCEYVCMYVCMFVCMYIRMYICMYVCIYVCMYVCMYDYVCVSMYVFNYAGAECA